MFFLFSDIESKDEGWECGSYYATIKLSPSVDQLQIRLKMFEIVAEERFISYKTVRWYNWGKGGHQEFWQEAVRDVVKTSGDWFVCESKVKIKSSWKDACT